MAKVLGIDLGTTNSCMAVYMSGEPVVVPNAEGGRTTPSVVAVNKDGEVLVGAPAKRQAVLNPDRTVVSIKRKMGTRERIQIDGKEYSPEQISAFILQKLKRDAEAYLGEEVKQAVITVPAYFNNSQRTATKQAGEIAGLEVLRIINEPTAASLAYGLDKKQDETILVYDLGGGTFDVSLLEVGEGLFEVKSTSGNTQLGGDDWDQRVMEWLVAEAKKDYGIDLSKDRQALQRLKEAAERAKVELSSSTTTTISLPFITATPEGPVHLERTLSRAQFEEMTSDLVDATKGPFNQALKDANIPTSELDEVILVGGSTRMPVIQRLAEGLTGKEPHKGVNPDEVVAVGAAIQGAVLAGETKDIVLLDVTPLSLGLETKGGVFHKLIPRNTTIPTRKAETFTTAEDGQTAVDVKVYQGEREIASYNKLLGTLRLDGIPPAPMGIPQIEVTFDIDANGILNVSARDQGTGKEQKAVIRDTGALSEGEVDKMVKEGEAHAEEDRRRREEIDTRNEADSFAHQLSRMLQEAGDKLEESDRSAIQQGIEDLRKASKEGTIEEVRQKLEELRQLSYRVSDVLYRQADEQTAQQAEAGDGGQAAGPAEGDVIDAEFQTEDEQ